MSAPPLTSRVLLGPRGVVHPLRYQPSAISRQIHAFCDLERIGIGRQLMTTEPACHEVTFRITLSAPCEPPSKDVTALLQFSKEGICCFPIGVALNTSSQAEGLVHKRER